jgi:hypothetical protein
LPLGLSASHWSAGMSLTLLRSSAETSGIERIP